MARRTSTTPRRKTISNYDIIGKRGVTLIDSIVSEIGFLWHPTGLEAGIDGYIEIRDLQSGEVTNNIIQVQSKATDKDFEKETSDSFEYTCEQRDLDYWLNGNAPVILVRSRPRTKEAYWVSIKDYFKEPNNIISRKIVFNKKKDILNSEPSCIQLLTNLSMPQGTGLYLSPMPKNETLYLNLMPIIEFPKRICIAQTEHRSEDTLVRDLKKINRDVGPLWMLHGGNIYSFYDLSAYPWNKICERGTVETYSCGDWGQSSDKVARDNFVRLLSLLFRYQLAINGLDYHEKHEFYYFRDNDELSEKKIEYRSVKRKASRVVFEPYKPKDSVEAAHYRHSAFEGRFVDYEGVWHLEINPSYHFTLDGRKGYRFAHNSLSGLKRIEKNGAVFGQVVAWAEILRSFFPPPNLTTIDDDIRMQFGSLLTVDIGIGIPDKAWLSTEEEEEAKIIQEDIEGMGLFGL